MPNESNSNVKSSNSYDVVILGAGVIGLSVATELLTKIRNLRVLVIDKENELGKHASGRNSGVLHSGFYYSPETLKAKFCIEGNESLKKLCADENIPVLNTGKIVVSNTVEEEETLKILFERGISNGVKLEFLDRKFLQNFEPLARTLKNFIWSPNTSVTDPKGVLFALSKKALGLGATIKLSTTCVFLDPGFIRTLDGQIISYRHLVNSTGVQADRVAKQFGFAKNLLLVPFMGVYRKVENSNLPLRTLVYPVPNIFNPFLGVHFTLTVNGEIKVGPTAIPVINREQYSFKSNWKIKDAVESIKGFYSIMRGNFHDLPEIIRSEIPKAFEHGIIKDAAKLVPASSNLSGWKLTNPGIRSQLVDTNSGKLLNDFLIEGDGISTHVLNAVSPGWTCALPFGKFISNRVLENLN